LSSTLEHDVTLLRAALQQCAANTDLFRQLQHIYREAENRIARLACACRACGRCCRFDEVEHRLYVSTIELAYLLAEPPASRNKPGSLRCPYQLEQHCTARDRRPLGCRMFYCDDRTQQLRAELYERFHQRIRLLHATCAVQYAYVELTRCVALVTQGSDGKHFSVDSRAADTIG